MHPAIATSYSFRNPLHFEAVQRLVALAPLLLEATEASTIDILGPEANDPVVKELRQQLVMVARDIEYALALKKRAYELPEKPYLHPEAERLHTIADVCLVLLDTLRTHVKEKNPERRTDLGNLFESHWKRLKALLPTTNPTTQAPRFRRSRVLPKGTK